MANREELGLIRGARGGQRDAQLALGRLYLYGSAGLPKSLPTALHWLERAAEQGSSVACELIGSHIPLEQALQCGRPIVHFYERAFDAGVLRAGVVLAQLTLEHGTAPDPARRAKALRALEMAAAAGIADASAMYARHQGQATPAARPVAVRASTPAAPAAGGERWRKGGDAPAPLPLSPLEQLWERGDAAAYLAHALPQARQAVAALTEQPPGGAHLGRDTAATLSRCARLLGDADQALRQRFSASEAELHQFLELAAAEQDAHAQLAMGLWQARMQVDGQRVAAGAGSANFKKAIRWLTLAGEQGLPQAWYALARIYIKPEFSQRNVADAQLYLERAAGMGYREAQLECGTNAWRARREHEGNDVRAVYWLQKAAAQGCDQASATLQKIAPRVPCVFSALARRVPAHVAVQHPLLAARLRLAAAFGLNRAEALLLDIKAADQGHCLVVDIRASYGRCKRRLIAISSVQERRTLDEVLHQFCHADPGPGGPEGNYRQRLYRLKTVMPEAHQCEEADAEPRVEVEVETEAESYEMAA